MSQENVEIVRSAYDAFNRGDVPAVLTKLDPSVEWDMTDYEGWLESDVYYGHEGASSFLTDWATIFPDYRADLDRIIDNGDDVVVFATQRGHGTGSGVGAELSYVQIMTVRNGKVVRVRTYSDDAAALEAVGLSE
jgi:ketosteroid isomerase-like protein